MQLNKKVVILVINSYTQFMERIDHRIGEAIRLLAEALGISFQEASVMLYPMIKDKLKKVA